MTCSLCESESYAKGKCRKHYMQDYSRTHYQKHKERIDARVKDRLQANPEKVRAEKSRYRYKNRERINSNARELYGPQKAARSRQLRTGMSAELVDRLRVYQEGRCALCTVQLILRSTKADAEQADHCHTTGQPRGLLCKTCNTSLGHYEKRQRQNGLVLQSYDDYRADPPAQRFVHGTPASPYRQRRRF